MPEERKLVTILFADVTGSTALGEALDPEDVRALMARYYQHARQVMLDHGGALGEAQTRQLVDPLVPELASEAVRARIVERAGGNPFFAIELAHGLAERLADAVDPASADAKAPPDTLPDTVYEAVLAPLDQLAEPEREALQVAAVAGRTFRLPTLLAALPERDPSTIATAVEGLLARDLVTPAEGAEDAAYTFRHILFRDVAYGTLARAERVRLHVAVAQWLEDVAADRLDEFVELLERVFPQSHPAAPVRRSIVAAYHADDPTRFDLDGVGQNELFIEWILLYFAEQGLSAPGSLIKAARAGRVGGNLREVFAEVAEALTFGDMVRLAAAIDAAEACHLVVHAARMRIVLAQRTGDPTPLARARPVLARLGDRQFLRRLEEVQGALT